MVRWDALLGDADLGEMLPHGNVRGTAEGLCLLCVQGWGTLAHSPGVHEPPNVAGFSFAAAQVIHE